VPKRSFERPGCNESGEDKSGTKMPNLDWGWLQSFLLVARTGRLTVAAGRLGIDHGTLSRRIDSLEKALNVRLFERKPSGYALTSAGVQLVQAAEAMETSSLHGIENVSEGDEVISGTVRIVAPDVLGSQFLAPRLSLLADKHPKLELQLLTTPRMSNLTKREADIAIGNSRPDRGRLAARKLTNFELGIYATPRYLERHPPIRSVNDLSKHRLIGYIDDLIFSTERNHWTTVSSTLRPTLSSTNMISQMNAALADGGLCILPCWMVHEDARLVRVLRDDPSLVQSYWLILNADMRNVLRVRSVCDFIAAEVAHARSLFLPARAE
jgi:DNA-binding transcriptional LysR family regulator